MTAPDEITFDRAVERIGRYMTIVSVLGTCGALAIGGWKTGLGFLLGALISGLNFRWLHKLVGGLGGEAKLQNRSVVLGFRYLILGGGAYVILRLSPISPKAVMAGLFVLTAAIFAEVVFELVYARK